jgi:hypothetical protein
MRESHRFLVIAEDSDRLSLIASTLQRKFPGSIVRAYRESGPAIELARTERFDAIITNTSTDLAELPLLESLRPATAAPIVVMSSDPMKPRALALGATRFLDVQRWLLIGTVVAEVVGEGIDEMKLPPPGQPSPSP